MEEMPVIPTANSSSSSNSNKAMEKSLQKAILLLAQKSSSIDEKMISLRTVTNYLQATPDISLYNTKSLNQLVMDTILRIIMNENQITNMRKRQLVRTELFVLLGTILTSDTLFGNIRSQIEFVPEEMDDHKASNENSRPISRDKIDIDVEEDFISGLLTSVETQRANSAEARTTGVSYSNSVGIANPLNNNVAINQRAALLSRSVILDSGGNTQNLLDKNFSKSTALQNDRSTPSKLRKLGDATSRSINSSNGFLMTDSIASTPSKRPEDSLPALKKSLIKNALRLNRKISKKLQPRPSVLFNEAVPLDGIVPGVDPMNYFEQDRKLGYQKPRMWFPTARAEINNSLVPSERKKSGPESASNRIVQEYMQMRALISYVGDLVQPFPVKRTKTLNDSNSTSNSNKNGNRDLSIPSSASRPERSIRRLQGVTDSQLFNSALTDAMKLWSPLVGINLPKWNKAEDAMFQKFTAPSSPKRSYSIKKATTSYTEDSSDSDSNEDEGELTLALSSKKGEVRKPSHLLIEEEANMLRYQRTIGKTLDAKMKFVQDSMAIAKAKIDQTIRAQYALLPPKFLLVLEGGKANSRRLIANAMLTFCRVKKLNYLALAFGTWKICLVQKESLARRPYYARNAAAFMMATWIVEVRTKKLKNWLLRWRYGVSIMIYTERYTSSVKIQSICRRWRDRQKFLSLHRQGNYNGILSDIYLAPERKKIKYKIPSEIRSTRRMYWKAAIFIQTMYRCWIECREYFYKRRQIVLLQSVGRMYSKYIWYRKLRATTIKCQAWARRTVKSIQYKRLKRATIIVQKYVRRYLSQLLVWRIFDRTVWRVDEARLAAAIMIQCRWRILKAKRKIKKMKFRQALREYSALVIQRNYYRSKKAFHTFFLMCCYRIRGEEDDKLDELATRMGRYKCARVIQRYYKLRYFQRIISSAIRIQCWFRGRLGYTLVRLMRKEKWAKRKLHHWARGRLRRRHRLIRQIQRWWWRLRKGRLLRHLWYKALMRDIEEDRIMAGKYFHGALRMQALIKGIWTRRWTTKYRAAMKIQRCMRAYLSRKHLRTWRRERMLKIVRKYVNNMIDERVRFRTAYLVRKHSEMIAKPQAMIRGYQVREKMQRAKDYAYRVGLAVVLIQRSWRKAGAVGRAVEELMSLRRMSANPFKKCETIHQLLYLMRKQTKQLYCTFDPRIGMKVSTLMYRLGLLELLEMFPKKEYVLVTDMQKLTMEKLEELYIRWRERIEQVKQTTNKNKNDQKDKKDQKKQKPRNIPTQSFQLILDVVTVPLFLRKRKYLGKVQMVQSLPDYTSPDRLELVIKSIFAKKFGKHLNTRANNLARDVIDMLWLKYNNFKAFGNVALTKGQLLRAIAITSEASHVLQFLQEIRSRSVAMTAEERNHDIDRLRKCSEQLQLAFDQARALLPEGIILDMFDKALTNVQFCRRRVAFIQTKLESDELKQLQLAKKNKNTSATNSSAAAATTTTTTTNAAHNPSANKKVVDNNSAELNAMPMWMSIELYRTPITVSQSLELSFHGTREDLQLELHASLCKIFADVLDKLWIASNGVQSIKNCWSNGALRRAMAVEKNKQFLEQAKNDYIADRQEDKVKIVWEKFRRQDTIARKVSNILNAIMERKANIEAWLQHICRFGWMELTDDYGYPYWLDNSPKANLSTYDMPTYTYKEWISVDKIQGVARKYIERQLEKRRIREEIKRREMEIAEEEHRKRLEEGLKAVKVTLSLKDRLIRKHVKRGKIETAFISTVPTVESMLPDRYQLDTHAVIRTGIWALLKSIINKDKDKSEPLEYKSYSSNWKYEIVVLYKVRHDQKQCEIRTVKGNRLSNIHFNRIVHMPYVVGTKVETRYKGLRLFYRSTIVKVHETIDREILYDVRYEDGEYEEKLARDVIRPSYTTLQEFLEGRKSIASGCISRHRRLLHVAKLKKDRVYNSSVALDKPNEVSIAAGETDGIPEEKSVDFTLLSIADDHTTTSSQLVELPTRLDAQIKIAYSRAAVRDDWELIVDPIARTATFEHKETKEIIDTLPSYSGVENVMAQRIQLRWLGFKAKKRLKRKIVSLSMKQLIYESIKKASKIAYVGYQFEGVTPMQMLRRCGHWELADAIELFYKIEKKDIRRVTYETLMNMSKESFESIGIVQVAHVRSLRELQLWWKKIKIKQRNIKLSFFNYYSNDYLDKRSMRDCIRDSEDQLFKKFLQIIPTSQSRTKQVCKMVATESHYPHTHLQIENYFKKFGDKPELARDNVSELINKQTTSNWSDEKDALAVYKRAAGLIKAMLSEYKMSKMKKFVSDAMKKADYILQLVPTAEQRPHGSGPEARAALILRRDVLAYVSEIVEAAIVIQRKVRGHVLHTKMKRLVKVRYEALGVIQRNGRKYLANKTAHFLRSQQNSEWEQLWDSNRELLYYYNYSTKRSQYTEPTEPFRPLVRDLRSAQLIQAWPDIDNRRGDIAYVPMVASNVSTLDVNSLCGVCKSRKFVRICRECYDEEDYYNTKNYNFPYCFTCFLREHTAENEKQDHEFVTTTSAEDGSSTVLRCCMCEEPAVRKCLGILSDKQIDAICNDMKRAHPDRWKSVLLSHDVGGDRKIDLMLDQITDNEPIDVVTTAHLQSIRSILQRMRSECDDCYCQNCYQEVHANGKRAKHHWKGFQEYAPVCAVCTNSPAENNCLECNSIYCESCYKVFHSMGRKRKHKTELVLEDLQQGIRRCNICKRRNGYIKCPNNRCTIHCCDSCYNFDHKFNCDKDQNNLNLQANAKGLQDNLCVNCGDPADNRCIQCNDAYCSRVERDFSGCFKLYHSKGNRVHHQQEPFKRPESRAATQSDGRIASRPDSRFSQRPNSRASTMKK